jgi:phosphoglycolate phosphatase-like HAD superfamily hydrolase
MRDRPIVVLFDIDGTLVTCGGAGRRAMERAFDEHTLARQTSDFSFGGMTDRAIVREALIRGERVVDDAVLEATLERYLTHLADELPRAAGYRVLDGVHETLDALEGEVKRGRRIAIGLGTGNLVRGAELKLRVAKLWERFAFGGFGSDHEDRQRLLDQGRSRGAAKLGVASEDVVTVVIGDTPRDVSAAQAIGARCIAIASGSFGRETMLDADVTLGSMRELRLDHVLG